jgi:PAS domain S-box-containing protein
MDKNLMDKPMILVVEDEAIIARDLQLRLERMGFEVPYIESTAQGAVQKALEVKPALILMDIVLGGDMDGIEAAKQIHSEIDTPIVYLTAFSSENIFEQARVTEPFGYLIKPTNNRELKSTIEIALYKHRVEKELVRARKEWEAIFDAIGQPAIILDPDHNIIEANKATLTASGMSKDELLGRKCYEIFHRSSEPPANCPMSKVLQSNQPVTETMELEAFDGLYLVSCTPVFDEEGRLGKIIHIAADITERRKMEG